MPQELAEDFELSAESTRDWVERAERDRGTRRDGLSSAEREELKRLRTENKQLRAEREMCRKPRSVALGKTNSIPPKSSSS